MAIKVTSEVQVYEVNGTETPMGERKILAVESHWNRPAFVVLDVNGVRCTVAARDLEAAIKNATNSGK